MAISRVLNLFSAIGLSVVTLFGTSCSNRDFSLEFPSVLRVGVLPDRNEAIERKHYGPLLAHLALETRIPCRLVIAKSYSNAVDLFLDEKVDISLFGAATFVKALHRGDADPLVMRDVDRRFKSCFLVRAGAPARTIEDCEGLTIAFGSALSTSGHLMPRWFLEKRGINPDLFFSEIRYSGAHDTTVNWVRDGVVDVGVTNVLFIDEMLKSGAIRQGEVRVLWQTPPYASYLWVTHRHLSSRLRNQIFEAFLKLSSDEPGYREILDSLSAEFYTPAILSDFRQIQEIVTLLPEYGSS